MAKGGFFSRIFGLDDEPEGALVNEQEGITEQGTQNGTTLQDAVAFVEELQSYYYNDVCKMQADLVVQTNLTEQEVNVAQKKINQDKMALAQIDQILAQLKECVGEFQSVWKKAVYSFYDEIEKQKLISMQTKVFTILLRLNAVNTKLELASVIAKRLENYRKAWNICENVEVPRNYNVILTDGKDGIETYRFGNFCKKTRAKQIEVELTLKQLEQIRDMEVNLQEQVSTDKVWVYVANVTRLQLNFIRRTCFVRSTWESQEKEDDGLFLDEVRVCDFEQYIKGVLQIVFTKNRYAIVTLVVPTAEMLRVIGPIRQEEEKIEICKRLRFILKERSGLYKDNLRIQRLDRRNLPQELYFMSYPKFRKLYF